MEWNINHHIIIYNWLQQKRINYNGFKIILIHIYYLVMIMMIIKIQIHHYMLSYFVMSDMEWFWVVFPNLRFSEIFTRFRWMLTKKTTESFLICYRLCLTAVKESNENLLEWFLPNFENCSEWFWTTFQNHLQNMKACLIITNNITKKYISCITIINKYNNIITHHTSSIIIMCTRYNNKWSYFRWNLWIYIVIIIIMMIYYILIIYYIIFYFLF